MSMSLTLCSAPASLNALTGNSLSPLHARSDVLEQFNTDTPASLLAEAYKVFNDELIAIEIGFPSLVALHIRTMSLQWFQVPVHHVRHKHDKVFLGVQQLRPPWPPPKVEIMDVHTQEAAGGRIHSLEIAGRILQIGRAHV